ncbi:MAG: hypothetical protein KBS40_02470, partial [Bacteroidales bacterium]|nr:hypothetical protein [Bacteroidales bacterium]
DVYAIFEDVCAPQTVIQLVDLYGQLMMVNVEDLHQQGYQPQEQDVFWYRIVGEQIYWCIRATTSIGKICH